MLSVLVVDDDTNKIKDIIRAIREVMREDQGSIEFCLDIEKARDLLSDSKYDLLILDIQLPFRMSDDTIQKNGGIELLNDIKSLTGIIRPNYIVGFTSFVESQHEYQDDFGQALWPIVKYDPAIQKWRDQLKEKVIYLLELQRQQENLGSVTNYDYDLAIITAVKIEHEAVLSLCNNWEKKQLYNDSTDYWIGRLEAGGKQLRVVTATQYQMGMTAASTLSVKLIEHFRPQYLSMVGILAGNKARDINMGDIVIAAESWDLGSGKIKEDENGRYLFQPEPHQLHIEVDIREKFDADYRTILSSIYDGWRAPKPDTILKLHVGAVASGSAVIQNENLITEFIDKHNRKLLGIDMETYGVYYAAHNATKPRPKVFSIKSVCDFADAKKNDDFQAYAAYTSAQFLHYFALNQLV